MVFGLRSSVFRYVGQGFSLASGRSSVTPVTSCAIRHSPRRGWSPTSDLWPPTS